MDLVFKYLIKNKNILILISSILALFIIFSSFKNMGGYDERNYIANGDLIIEEGLEKHKIITCYFTFI